MNESLIKKILIVFIIILVFTNIVVLAVDMSIKNKINDLPDIPQTSESE